MKPEKEPKPIQPPKKILLINTFGIGDVLFSTPLIAAIKEGYPDCKIGYVSNARTYEIFFRNPRVENGFIYERDDWHKLWKQNKVEYFRSMAIFLLKIRKIKFDMAIDLSLSPNFTFFLMLIGIKVRVGFDYKRRGRFLTHKLPLERYHKKHVSEYYLDLLKILNLKPVTRRLEFYTNDDDKSWADGFMAANNLGIRDLIVAIVPGGGASWGAEAHLKRLAVFKFAKVADKLIENFGAKVIIFGSPQERLICHDCERLMHNPVVNACSKTSVVQFGALLARCKLLIANDGGPLHVGVALGVNSVSIFGPVDDNVYGPYPKQGQHIVIKKGFDCQPCYQNFRMPECKYERRCLEEVSIEEVYRAASQLITE